LELELDAGAFENVVDRKKHDKMAQNDS